jgi:hypothetical protein
MTLSCLLSHVVGGISGATTGWCIWHGVGIEVRHHKDLCYANRVDRGKPATHNSNTGLPSQALPSSIPRLPLSPFFRLSKIDLQPLVDKIVGHIPTWKASMLERSGRLTLIDSSIAATPIYHMLCLDLP